MGLMFGKKVQR